MRPATSRMSVALPVRGRAKKPDLARRAVLVVLLGLLAPVSGSYGATGDLDTSFDTDGRVTTDFAGGTDNGRQVAIQPSDGKIVVSGFDSTAQDFVVARYNTDGSLDATFDTDGKVTTDFGSNEQAHAIALQADGKIVVAGLSNASGNFDFALARYNTDGSLDTSFDTDGRVTTDLGSSASDQAFAVIVQSDGKIVAGGHSGSADFAVVRYNTDGSLDTTFDTDGRVLTDFGGNDQAKALAQALDGKILAVGFANPPNDVAVARYNTDGSLDTTFDTDGKVTADITGSSDQARAVVVQSDGKVVVAGLGNSDFIMARLNTDGSLDTTFDTDGKVSTDFNASSNDQAFHMCMQPDGKFVVVGLTNATGNYDFAVARYQTNGRLDTSFSTDGLLTVDLGSSGNDQGYGVAMQSDGKIVLSGLANGVDFGAARIDAGTVPVELSRFLVE